MARGPATLRRELACPRATSSSGYTSSATYDALNRIVTDTTPDASVTRHSYDEGGYLTKLEVQHRGSSTWTTVVHAVEHDAHGRRTRVERGDDGTGSAGLTTSYTYDPKSQRVTRIVTERSSDSAVLQDLRYHTDAVGLVTKVRDVSQQTHYYANAVVSADLDYHYDPLYRLVEASGRESTALGSTQHGATLPAMGPQPDASDPAAMRRYTQTYEYDPADNLIKLVHTPVGGTGRTRRYNRSREAAEVASPTLAQRAARESGSGRGAASWGRNYTTTGNRLQSTSISGDSPGATYTTPGTYTYSDHYEYDEHGSMTSMPHLPTMTWGHRDELTECTVGSETLHFQYAGGQRIRKHVTKTGSTTEERVYIGRYEKYTRRISGAEDMVRETLHLGDDLGRVAMVETKTVEGGTAVGSPTPMWRHPLGNMLGTAGGETTEDGSVIGYEEYHPYGTTAYRAKASGIDVSERRYRYTGMEQDEETGLGYHTARYYAGGLGRWVSADPIGLGGGGNRFGYVGGNPVGKRDPGGMDPPTETKPPLSESDLALQSDEDIRSHPSYFDEGIASITYFGEEKRASVEYESGESLTIDTADVTTSPRVRGTPGSVSFGVSPADLIIPEIESDYTIDESSGRVIPGEVNYENAPNFTAMLKEARRQFETGTRKAAEAGVEITSNPSYQALVLGPSINQLISGVAVLLRARRAKGPAAPVKAEPVVAKTGNTGATGAAKGGVELLAGGVRRPASRHTAQSVKQKTRVTGEENTVIDPSVNVAADVEAINAGQGTLGRTANGQPTVAINGRTYVVESTGTLSPRTGPGFSTLSRKGFRTLGILNELGPTPDAFQFMANRGIPVSDQAAAFRVWAGFQ